MTLTPEDWTRLSTNALRCELADRGIRARLQLVYGHKNWSPNHINGTSPADLDVSNWQMARGDFFTDHDVASVNMVCVIGQTLSKSCSRGRTRSGKRSA